MISFNIGSYLSQLTRFYPFTQITQTYDRGVVQRTLLPPENIMAHIQPRKLSTDQKMQKNSDRVIGQVTIFTLVPLDLTRQGVQATQVTFKGNEYFVTSNRDWSEFGYYQYFGELIIPQSTG
jgi:hypothetical protein